MMWSILFIPFVVQLIVILLDEFVFHIHRDLPKWERIGHPLDTLTVIALFAYALWIPYTPLTLKGFIALAVFSCIFVTKDEFVHKHHCPASEQWLHSFLFLNHPVMMAAVGIAWAAGAGMHLPSWLGIFTTKPELIRPFLFFQLISTSLFCLYQIIYWNFLWKSTTRSTTT